MDQIERIAEFTRQSLEFLSERHGFAPPIIKRGEWSTTISSLSAEIAFEVELDWRELDVFVLVTALEGGRLPSGYYVSQGKECRTHLEHVLQRKLGVAVSQIQAALGPVPKHRERNERTLETRIAAYTSLMEQYVRQILERGLGLFAD